MRLLIDTHIALWFIDGSDRLSKQARELIARPENTVYVSDVSLWEIAIKRKKSPDLFRYSVSEYVDYFRASDFNSLHLDLAAVISYEALDVSQADGRHRDPFDRMLIAQARSENLLFITHDKQLELYDEPLVKVV